MPEITQHVGLKKPLASETADISVINENMDTIDLALGDLSAVPTTAKTTAGAITELHEAIQDIDVDIPDGSITPEKLSFDPATQAELDAHANATNVHGATSAATASRLIIRDAAGRAKVAAPAASDDIALLSSITKAQAGLGSVDNYATANQAQAEAGAASNLFMTPQRVKQAIDKLTGGVPLRVDSGQLEFYDGTEWRPVGVPYPGWLADLDAFNDGTDGAFSPSVNTTLPAGIHRFSSINIPAGVTVTSSGSFLVLLAKGNANIAGTISASGKGSAGGANSKTPGVDGVIAAGAGGGGGYHTSGGGGPGGNGGNAATPGGNAGDFGNSAGKTGASTTAALVETLDAMGNYSIIAGGGGGRGGAGGLAPGGYGGGAVIVVAKQISGAGAIRADGLSGAAAGTTGGGGGGGGGGLAVAVARSISNLTLSATGGAGGSSSTGGTGGAGGNGFAIKITK